MAACLASRGHEGNAALQREVVEMGVRRLGWEKDEARLRGMEGWFNF